MYTTKKTVSVKQLSYYMEFITKGAVKKYIIREHDLRKTHSKLYGFLPSIFMLGSKVVHFNESL